MKQQRKDPSRTYDCHGLATLKAAVRTLGGRVVDRRTKLGKALAAWRADLIEDLGGAPAVSTQRAALVDLAVRTKLLLDSVDAWLLSQRSLVNKRRKSLIPAVRERLALSAHLVQVLKDLGLQRRAREVGSLAEYLRERSTIAEEPCNSQTPMVEATGVPNEATEDAMERDEQSQGVEGAGVLAGAPPVPQEVPS